MRFLQFLSLFVILTATLASNIRNGRIAGGEEAERGRFPWHAKLEAFDGRVTSLCGGALIRYDWILTSAHCIKDSVDIIIRLGMVDRLEGEVSAIFRITNRNHIVIHPEYDDANFANDLALLYLEGSDTLWENAPYVKLIDLPTSTDYEFVGLNGYVSGFGLMDDSFPPLLSMRLRYASMSVISQADCQQAHGNSLYWGDKLCTNTTGGISPCIGDEGGPFVIEYGEGYVLGGIASVANYECTAGYPAIFTSLLAQLDWIEDTVDEAPQPDTTTTRPPGDSDKCNCICRCYTCPGPAPPTPEPALKGDVNDRSSFWRR